MLTIENKLKMKDLGGASRSTHKASDAEKIAQAFKVSLRRMFSFGIIEFDDTVDCNVIIKDDKAFAEQIKYVGFKSADTYKKVLHKLGRTAFILVFNYEEELED